MKKEKLTRLLKRLDATHWTMTSKIVSCIIMIVVLIGSITFFAKDNQNNDFLSESRTRLRSALYGLATYASDYDKDGIIEPPAATDMDGRQFDTPAYFIPPSFNVNRFNINRIPYLYCAWDYGSATNAKLYYLYKGSDGQTETIDNPAPTVITMALVDAGKNRRFETTCYSLASGRPRKSDDIVEILNLIDVKQLALEKNYSRTKLTNTCPFGQVYLWNEPKKIWECQIPSAEQTAQMPAGCPAGQVLIERNKKIRCEGNQHLEDNVGVKPSTTEQVRVVSDNKPNTSDSQQVVSANQDSLGQSNVAASHSIDLESKNLDMINDSARVESQKAIVQSRNGSSDHASADLTPGADFIMQSQGNKDDSKIEIEVKRTLRTYKMASCHPWRYLPRSIGTVNQCIRINAFGDLFGSGANMTSWPAAQSFLQTAFMFCPIGEYGEKPPCRYLHYSKTNFTNRQRLEQDGFICSRVINPLPPPWPQFESFVYSENFIGGGACPIDRLPSSITMAGDSKVLCAGLADIIDNYRNNGFCGCGWSLIWNATASKFQCS